MIEAVASLVYGLLMIVGGVMGYRVAKSRASLIAGCAVGGLATLGGLALLLGNEGGRGAALVGALVAALFFGWKTSQAALQGQSPGRAGGIFALSAATLAALLLTRPPA